MQHTFAAIQLHVTACSCLHILADSLALTLILHAPTISDVCCLHSIAGLGCPLPIVSSAAAASSTPSSSRSSLIGVLTNHMGDMGMAYIKLAPALAAAVGQGAELQVQLEGGVVQQVLPQRPEWWPSVWGNEEASPPASSS
jgi:hypothetical protein